MSAQTTTDPHTAVPHTHSRYQGPVWQAVLDDAYSTRGDDEHYSEYVKRHVKSLQAPWHMNGCHESSHMANPFDPLSSLKPYLNCIEHLNDWDRTGGAVVHG
jgi:hypothetical protein